MPLNSVLKQVLLDNGEESGRDFMETIGSHEVFTRHNLKTIQSDFIGV